MTDKDRRDPRRGQIERRIISLGGRSAEPQGEQNREPPANAPTHSTAMEQRPVSATIRKEGPLNGTLHEVRARFGGSDAMQSAVDRLKICGFDRANLSLPEVSGRPRAGSWFSKWGRRCSKSAPKRWRPREPPVERTCRYSEARKGGRAARDRDGVPVAASGSC